MITLRIEIMTRERLIEIEEDEPENWATMTPAERDAYCAAALEDVTPNYVGTGWSYEGQEQ